MSLSPEVLNRIAGYRAKAADGTLTKDDMRAAIILMRQNRITAQATSTPKAKSKVQSKSTDALLNELENL